MGNSGLADQTIGIVGKANENIDISSLSSQGSFYNVYHLLIPYYIGDNRINISPVYIYDFYQTSLSLSKTNVKFGNYFYPSSVSDGKLFVLNINKIVQTDKVVATAENLKIGDNNYEISPIGDNRYFVKSNGKFIASNIGMNINQTKTDFEGWTGIIKTGEHVTGINFGQLAYGGVSYNGKVSYVIVQQESSGNPAQPINIEGNASRVGNTYWVGPDLKVQIPVNSNGESIKFNYDTDKVKIIGFVLNDSNE